MSFDPTIFQKMAQIVDHAAVTATPIPMLSTEFPELTLETAYLIQRASMQRRFERGERLVGMKMGLTSRAKMEQMGVHNPIYGHLTSAMQRNSGDVIEHSHYCHPRVEPEIAFFISQDISGKVTSNEAFAAVGGICAALEVIDSRYADFKFTLNDVVADNASSTAYFLGEIVAPATLDVSNLGMVMAVNGLVRETGSSAAIFDHPLRSLTALIHMLADVGEGLKAGQVVLAGGATAAIPCQVGDHVTLDVQELGRVEFKIV